MTHQMRSCNFLLISWGLFSVLFCIFFQIQGHLTHLLTGRKWHYPIPIFLDSHCRGLMATKLSYLSTYVLMFHYRLTNYLSNLSSSITISFNLIFLWTTRLDQAIWALCRCYNRKWLLALISCCIVLVAAHIWMNAWIEWRVPAT